MQPWSRRNWSLAALVAGACRPASDVSLVVAAASSLTEVFTAIAERWKASGGRSTELVFDASSRLARQIEAGMPANVFASADARWMDTLSAAGRIDTPSRRLLCGNRLVLVVPRSRPAPADLAGLAAIGRLALAGPEVPAGRYAREALESAGLLTALGDRIVEGDSVRTALAWAARGEVDAAIVYASDAQIEPRVEVAFTLEARSHGPIVYPIAAVAGRPHLDDALRFVEFTGGEETTTLLRAAGFTVASYDDAGLVR